MQNTLKNLESIIQDIEKYYSKGIVLKNIIIEDIYKGDTDLIKLIMSEESLKKVFFYEIDDNLIFKRDDFIDFINNKNFLPNSYTKYKQKIGLTDNRKDLISKRRDIVLNWPYKDCVLVGGQDNDDVKRKEVFYNHTLAPDEVDRLLDNKAFTKFTKITTEGEEDITALGENENYLIKGNNLITLHSLKAKFEGQVKLIYIDPPYNTGGTNEEFLYNNTFNHSTWLTFMKNRLEVAKELLTDDGSIIIAIDKHEQLYLGVLINEIFKDYDSHCITVVHNPRGVQGTNFSYTHEYAFFVIPKGQKTILNKKIEDSAEISWSNFRNWGSESERSDAKNCFYPIIVENDEIVGFGEVLEDEDHPGSQTVNVGNQLYVYPIDNSGVERKWRYAYQSIQEIIHLLRLRKTADGYQVEIGKDFEMYKTVWIDEKYDANIYGKQLLKRYVPNSEFSFPKSLYTVTDCLKAVIENDPDALVLDFFGGSGTTAHAVMNMNQIDGGNRRFILTEQMYYIEDVIKTRLQNVINEHGEGSFVYMELAKFNEIYVEKIHDINSDDEIYGVWNELKEKAFITYEADFTKMQNFEDDEDFKELSLEDKKQTLLDILDMNQLYINYSEIEDEIFNVEENEIALNNSFYEKDSDALPL